MMMARAKWRAVSGRTALSMAPSRRCRCQSSGRRMVRLSVMGPGYTHPRPMTIGLVASDCPILGQSVAMPLPLPRACLPVGEARE
jgi:hypothetical protein